MSNYAIMPLEDYDRACDAIRAKTGKSDPIESGDMAREISYIEGGEGGVSAQRTLDELISRTITKIDSSAPVIGQYAFGDCTQLTEINSSAQSIIMGAFYQCTSLKVARFSELITIRGLRGIPSLVKLDCAKASSIGDEMGFHGNRSMETLILRNPDGLYYEGGELFVIWEDAVEDYVDKTDVYIYVPSALVEGYKTGEYGEGWVRYADNFRAIEDYPEICE